MEVPKVSGPLNFTQYTHDAQNFAAAEVLRLKTPKIRPISPRNPEHNNQ